MPTRRHFLIQSTALLTVGCGPKRSTDDVRVAICGLHGRGKYHLADLQKLDYCKVVALCDCDSRELDEHSAGLSVKKYQDFRKLCEDKDVDAIMIATPNHTHALIALTAIQHGKHVYVEKPISHNIREGRLLAEAAAKRPNLVVTHGMQRRADTGWDEAFAWIKEGHFGTVTLSRGLNFKTRESIGKVDKPKSVNKQIDYNLWCGPRPMTPVMRKLFHYDWHWQWPYGNGDIGNQGPHQLDVARWALAQEAHPLTAMSLGQRWGYIDDGESPNNQLALFQYAEGAPLLFDNRGLPMKDMDWGQSPAYQGIRIGNVVHCEGGFLAESKAFDLKGNLIKKFSLDDGGNHQQNWINAIRQGKLVSSHQSILHGHYSAALAHMANISWRLGKKLPEGEIQERIKGIPMALETLEDFKANLAANKIDMTQDLAITGPTLRFDPVSERFTGEFSNEANKLCDEEYREEFQLPVIS
ncbi:MAG: Gfo/Idh/MocA family oxidoreductase [Verrucomicrobiaceae bacterium]|nr:Gfo/Idh/MocA family oxidoreductase [Verrucomicrobiaceae bacterium]